MHAILRRAALGFLLAGFAAPVATAQTAAPGPRWTAWTGCWRLVTERGTFIGGAEQPTVCVAEVPGGARLVTTVSGRAAVEQTILTDGAAHPVDEAGCTGTQRNDWAASGLRLFTSAELTCAGDPAPRRVSGYGLLLQDGSWLDIQAVEINSRDTVRVRKFRHADTAVSPRPLPGLPFSLEDVKEASSRVSIAALEAAVVETGAAIPLSAKMLLDLEKAKVPGRVIDLMVAVAYPEKFVVERSASADRGWLPPLLLDDPFAFGMFGSPVWGSALGLYDYNPYFYSPFAYSYYGRYDPRFVGPGGGVYVVNPGGDGIGGGSAPPPVQASGTARAVDGRGYTQVRPRDPVPAERSPGSPNVASAGSATPTSSTSSSSSSSSGGSASSSGSSSGGDTGRTAVPR
jgi:hypothetical protein